MAKKITLLFAIVLVAIAGTFVLHYVLQRDSSPQQLVERVHIEKVGDIYSLNVYFVSGIKFLPRIHTLRNGAKIIVSFSKAVAMPKATRIDHEIINGCFFERLGTSSLMLVFSLKENIAFIEKKQTANSLKLIFKLVRKKNVMIDAGHGGRDSGASCLKNHNNKHAYDYEKNVTLVMAVELRNLLRATERYNVILTRERDEFMSAKDRKKKIALSRGDVLISLHTDSHDDKNMRGISIYTLSNLDLMKNKGDKKNFEKNIKQYNDLLSASRKFANILMKYIPNMCKIKNRPCRNAELKILKSGIPSILIELGCVSNEKDNELLHSRDFRYKTNRAVLYALDDFFAKSESR